MTEHETDSIGQFRPKDSILLRRTEQGEDGEPVVTEEHLARIPQWRQRFERSPLLPEGMVLDTSTITAREKGSHVIVGAEELGDKAHIVALEENGVGAIPLQEGVELVVDASTLVASVRRRAGVGARHTPSSTSLPQGGRRRGW